MNGPRPEAQPARPVFLLFSGHNERAVLALCRYFTRAGLGFAIVAAGPDDAIYRTAYRSRVVYERSDPSVGVALLRRIVGLAAAPLVYVPTTEFINHFVLRHRAELAGAGLHVGLPAREVYERLTGKLASQALMDGIAGVRLPARLPMQDLRAPCVLKPCENLHGDRVAYPLLCDTPQSLDAALAGLDGATWFAQEYLRGQSYYLCAYLCRDGRRAAFWQENLMQQADGKSIVLARTGDNPGIDADALFARLHAIGYHGPLMVEFICDERGLHYIETNPRFWGPLQLALDACPALLELFVLEHGAMPGRALPPSGTSYYAWSHGARRPGTRLLPAGAALPDAPALLRRHDLYGRPDTLQLHDRH